jgi:hypothetical protein
LSRSHSTRPKYRHAMHVRRFARARHPRRLLEPVTRRRLATVGTVQSQPSLKLGDARFQRRDLGRLRLDQCNQFFSRWPRRGKPQTESRSSKPLQIVRVWASLPGFACTGNPGSSGRWGFSFAHGREEKGPAETGPAPTESTQKGRATLGQLEHYLVAQKPRIRRKADEI